MYNYQLTLRLQTSVLDFLFFEEGMKFPITKLKNQAECTMTKTGSEIIFTYSVKAPKLTDEHYKDIETLYFDIIQGVNMSNLSMESFSRFVSFMRSTLERVDEARKSKKPKAKLYPIYEEFIYGKFTFDVTAVYSYQPQVIGDFTFTPINLSDDLSYKITATHFGKPFETTLTIRGKQGDATVATSLPPIYLSSVTGLSEVTVGGINPDFMLLISMPYGLRGARNMTEFIDELLFVEVLQKAIDKFVVSREEIPLSYRSHVSPLTCEASSLEEVKQGECGGIVVDKAAWSSAMVYPGERVVATDVLSGTAVLESKS